MAPPVLAACRLPAAWSKCAGWTVLDTDVKGGDHFLSIWRAWKRDPDRPRVLHYVMTTDTAPGLTETEAMPLELTRQIADAGPGFHRILLDDAHVSLTLCIGKVHAVLAEQVFHGDTLIARTPIDKWEVQALVRRCKRGTRFWIPGVCADTLATDRHSQLCALLRAAGLQPDPGNVASGGMTGVFDPQWSIPNSRTPAHHVQTTAARCAVVGAGIAGASVARALAVRGWQVTVFDRHGQPAGGASGLPAGLAVPHISADDNPRSRMSRSGTRLLRQHAECLLLRGQDWEPTGVTECLPEGGTRWHAQACWIKPAQLVKAWLAQPGVRFVGGRNVTKLARMKGVWHLFDAEGELLGDFEAVVAANAMGCVDLLSNLPSDDATGAALHNKLQTLQTVYGTLSHGRYAQDVAGLPQAPVNGDGCFIPRMNDTSGVQWFAGSTFETDAVLAADGPAQHAANMERLQRLVPLPGIDLIEALNRAPVSLWSSARCVTHDRMPLVGPVDHASGPGLWLCAGMGSRGLSFSALCAELLVARMGAEPLPLEFSLSRCLDANRIRHRHAAGAKNNAGLRPFAANPPPGVG